MPKEGNASLFYVTRINQLSGHFKEFAYLQRNHLHKRVKRQGLFN